MMTARVRMTLKMKFWGRARVSSFLPSSESSYLPASSATMASPSFAMRFFSCRPQKMAVPTASTRPTICMGMSWNHRSLGSISMTFAARMVGPPQGIRFMTPIAVTQMSSRVSRRMCRRL